MVNREFPFVLLQRSNFSIKYQHQKTSRFPFNCVDKCVKPFSQITNHANNMKVCHYPNRRKIESFQTIKLKAFLKNKNLKYSRRKTKKKDFLLILTFQYKLGILLHQHERREKCFFKKKLTKNYIFIFFWLGIDMFA